jgi:4-amino-4-deoxy-L-arabinose transferase-like glycosyltransferase
MQFRENTNSIKVNSIFKNYKEFLIVGLILLLGLSLRLYKLDQRTSFDADQEWLATRSYEMLAGDTPLLGPVTSVGNFSIGPGFIYLWSIVGMFTNSSPISGAYLSVILGVVTLLAFYLFCKHFVDSKTAYVFLFLTSISSNLIFWDQSPWAPSLFYVSQIILLTGAYLATKNKLGYILIALGFIGGFQSHFGIVLSFISVVLYFIFVRPVKIDLKTLLWSLFVLVVGLSPNIIFDLTHNFSNIKKIADAIKGEGVSYFVGLNKIINVLNINTTSIIYPRNNNLVDSAITKGIFALVIVNGISLLRNKVDKNVSLLLLITGIFPAILFYFQQGKFSEYYLMMTVPSLLLLVSLLIKKIISKKILIGLVLIVSIYLNLGQINSRYVSWNLKAKSDIAKTIVSIGGYDDYGISLNSKLGNQFGFNYIFKHYGIKADIPPKKGETKIFSVIIPQGFDGMVGTKTFDGIGLLWQGI